MDLEWVGADDQVKQQLVPLVSAPYPPSTGLQRMEQTPSPDWVDIALLVCNLALHLQTVFALTHKDSFVADSGGLWRSTDGGSSFEELTGKLKSRCCASDSSSRMTPGASSRTGSRRTRNQAYAPRDPAYVRSRILLLVPR